MTAPAALEEHPIARLRASVREKKLAAAPVIAALGISARQWYYICNDPDLATEAMQRKARRLLAEISGDPAALALDQGSIFNQYWLLAVIAARALGVDLECVKRHPPKSKATANPEYLAAARVRELALYLANTSLGIRQHRLAKALGVTPAAICRICRKVEDQRDDDVFDRLVDALEGQLCL